jgi:multicomponent Na+:H+ antiporter subunit C
MMNFNYIMAMLLVTLGLYCVLVKRNLIKLIIGLSVLTDGVHLFLISMGYRAGGIAPIVTGETVPESFAALAVDPVPQALVLTSIVINVCILALALSLSIYAYRHYGTLRLSELRGLKE